MNSKHEERKYFEAFMGMMDVQVKEMKSMGEAIRKLESTKDNDYSKDKQIEDYIKSAVGNGTTNNSWRTPQVVQPDTHLSSVVTEEVKVNGTTSSDNGAATVEPTTAPHSKSYMEILAMIQRGERPPNIREIDDMPPNPNQQPTKPLLAPKPKPWEVPGIGQENGGSSHSNQETSSDPWWRKKTVKITDMEPEAVEPKGPVRRWVPPQPPSVAIPEAAAAIRQPKPSVQKQPSGESNEESSTTSTSEIAHANNGNVGVEPESSGGSSSSNVPKESYQSEIEEVREVAVEI